MGRRHVLLGDFLLEQGLITKEDLRKALKYQKETGKLLGRCFIELGILDEKTLIKALSEQMGVQYVSLKKYKADPKVIKLIPEDFARAHKVFPLFKIGRRLTVGMVNPLDVITIDQLRQMTGMEIEPVVCHEQDIEEAIDLHYKGSDRFKEAMESFKEDTEEEGVLDERSLRRQAEEGPVVKLVNLVLSQAIKEGASDIHIQPREKSLSIRYRIDGVLHEVFSPPKSMQLPIASRIKILANLNIAETRLPQDGRFRFGIDNKVVDFRVSTLPTAFGENIVLRLLDTSRAILGFPDLGMNDKMIEDFRSILHKPYGIILVTGPTGSGKSTTLYAALRELDTPEKNIITLEDPIEYHLDTIRQSQVNPKIGMTFANGLRAILRQDPDIIMVGEIRDLETAEIAIKAALTGHLVLSTLHTNDAAGAVTRLLDMGLEPFLVASAVQGVLAQRLVRRICPYCVQEYEPDKKLVRIVAGFEDYNGETRFLRGKGCSRCKNTGYKGRIGIYELLIMDDNLRELVNKRASATEIAHAARKAGMKSMIMDGLEKVEKGITTIEEVFRVTQV